MGTGMVAVFDLSGKRVGGVYPPPLVKDDPLTGDCKIWSGVGFDPSKRSKIQIRR